MPSGAGGADFELSGEPAEQARAASSGPEVVNVGWSSVSEAGRTGLSSEALVEHLSAPAEISKHYFLELFEFFDWIE